MWSVQTLLVATTGSEAEGTGRGAVVRVVINFEASSDPELMPLLAGIVTLEMCSSVRDEIVGVAAPDSGEVMVEIAIAATTRFQCGRNSQMFIRKNVRKARNVTISETRYEVRLHVLVVEHKSCRQDDGRTRI